MCGRFVATTSPTALAEVFDAEPPDTVLASRYNVAPTTDVYGVVEGADRARRIAVFRWGLVPSWARDASIGSRLINARGETLVEKPSFARSFTTRRLIVPMDGFYEWQPPASPRGPKRPVFVHRRDGAPIAAAGLWAAWKDPAVSSDAAWLHSCTIITTAANALMAPVHDRMPVVLERRDWDEWLDPANHDTASLVDLLVPAADEVLTRYEVGTAVNKVQHDDPSLISAIRGDDGMDGPR
ncbi:MAG: SOS response-associated peptidase [Ilumatobacteraceae bacterium]